MKKVHLIGSNDPVAFQNAINEFIADKAVVDIKYQPMLAVTDSFPNAAPRAYDVFDRALIIYEEVVE